MSETRVSTIIRPASRQRMSHAENKSYIQRSEEKKKSGVAVTGLVIIVSLGASLTLVKFFQYSNISNNDNFLISCSSRTNK